MQKTTRAFRTISEAGSELELQPHVLRFWESKFSDIKPIKRGGGRRFYRPEDIEFLRGIKILLHDEKHPIKDVQKLIRLKGPQRVIDLGRSVERAVNEKDISETVLIPKRIVNSRPPKRARTATTGEVSPDDVITGNDRVLPFNSVDHAEENITQPIEEPIVRVVADNSERDSEISDRTGPVRSLRPQRNAAKESELEAALARLKSLRERWDDFMARA